MINRILLYNSGGGLGDSIQLYPLILSLKNHFEQSEFYYLSAHDNHYENKLKEYNINIKTLDLGIKYFGFRWWHFFIAKKLFLKKNISQFDLIIDLQTKLRNTLILKKIPTKNFYSETGDLYIFSSKEFYSITFTNHKKFNKYEDLQIVLKDNDTNYKIYAIQGIINYVNNISKCTKELDNIEIELDKIFKISDKSKRNILNTESDRVGKYTLDRFAYFVGNNTVQVSCADYLDNEKFNIRDALRIAIRSEEFNKFVDTQ